MSFLEIPGVLILLNVAIALLMAFQGAFLSGMIAKTMRDDASKRSSVALSFCVVGFILCMPKVSAIEGTITASAPIRFLVIAAIVHVVLALRFDYLGLREGFNIKRILWRRPSEK